MVSLPPTDETGRAGSEKRTGSWQTAAENTRKAGGGALQREKPQPGQGQQPWGRGGREGAAAVACAAPACHSGARRCRAPVNLCRRGWRKMAVRPSPRSRSPPRVPQALGDPRRPRHPSPAPPEEAAQAAWEGLCSATRKAGVGVAGRGALTVSGAIGLDWGPEEEEKRGGGKGGHETTRRRRRRLPLRSRRPNRGGLVESALPHGSSGQPSRASGLPFFSPTREAGAGMHRVASPRRIPRLSTSREQPPIARDWVGVGAVGATYLLASNPGNRGRIEFRRCEMRVPGPPVCNS